MAFPGFSLLPGCFTCRGACLLARKAAKGVPIFLDPLFPWSLGPCLFIKRLQSICLIALL
jgi:hypothetical protein